MERDRKNNCVERKNGPCVFAYREDYIGSITTRS